MTKHQDRSFPSKMVTSYIQSSHSSMFFFSRLLPCHSIIFIVLYLPSSPAKFLVLTSGHSVVRPFGADALLACHLSPAISAEHMEIRWFRSQFHSPVHLYRDSKDENDQQLPEYRGRTELITDDIRNGSVQLKIRNVSIEDEGQYKCFFDEKSFYEEAILELKVSGIGSAPHIHVAGHRDGGVEVVCKSTGWYPKPEVLWRWDTGESLTADSESILRTTQGLFEVENAITVREASSSKLSCCVRNALVNDEKVVTITIDDVFFPRVSRWMIFFYICLAGFGIFIILTIWYIKKKREKAADLHRQQEERIELLRAEVDWRRASVYRESVILDGRTAYCKLLLSADYKNIRPTDQVQNVDDNEECFDTEPCILGLPGFSTGRHYWEVEVQENGGRFWSVGAAEETLRRKGGFRESPEDGILAFRVHEDQFLGLTNNPTPVSLTERPERIGVFLDFEGGQLSFFNAVRMQHIFTFRYTFTKQMFPFFYIGQGTEFTVF